MKKVVFISLFFLVVIMITNLKSQKLIQVDPPAKIKDSVEALYGKVQNIKWFIDDDNDYIAKFVYNNQKITMLFSQKGFRKETRTEVNSKEIPSRIHSYINQEFPSDLYVKNKIDKIELVETPDSRFYYITVNSTGIKDPIELWFKISGELLKKNVPQQYIDRKIKRNPEDQKSLDEKILKDDFTTEDENNDEIDPTEELEKKGKKKNKNK